MLQGDEEEECTTPRGLKSSKSVGNIEKYTPIDPDPSESDRKLRPKSTSHMTKANVEALALSQAAEDALLADLTHPNGSNGEHSHAEIQSQDPSISQEPNHDIDKNRNRRNSDPNSHSATNQPQYTKAQIPPLLLSPDQLEEQPTQNSNTEAKARVPSIHSHLRSMLLSHMPSQPEKTNAAKHEVETVSRFEHGLAINVIKHPTKYPTKKLGY